MIYVTSGVAFAVTFLFYGGILINNKNISSIQTFESCSDQLKTCKITSGIFVLLYWFVVSGMSKSKCLEGYAKLSSTCSRLGCIWIVIAVINIILSIYMGITKKNTEAIATMNKLRSSSFLMGTIFLIVSFVLKVG